MTRNISFGGGIPTATRQAAMFAPPPSVQPGADKPYSRLLDVILPVNLAGALCHYMASRLFFTGRA